MDTRCALTTDDYPCVQSARAVRFVFTESRGTGVKNVEVRQGVFMESKRAGVFIVEVLGFVGINV
jgi:hypothetical protein